VTVGTLVVRELHDHDRRLGIEKDSEEGKKAGVQGTPGFFINGVILSGAQPQDAFTRLIDDELQMKSNRRTASLSVTRVER
jgi:predicted DsbA family dithiol-disulfide isomerase